jgi:isopenicillin N synthase-like dioxygenase
MSNIFRMTSAQLDPSLLAERVAVESIPMIDVGPLVHGSAASRREVSRHIGAACRDIGFFGIANHDIPSLLVQQAFDQAARFFALPTASKAEIAIEQSTCHRGWFSVGGENLDPAKQQYAGDFKEGIKIGQDLPTNHSLVTAGVPLHGPNQWPASPAEFVPTFREYYALLSNLARALMRAFALALELPESYFDEFLTRPMATVGPLHYPPPVGPITDAQLGAGAHTDFGALTILAQDANGGLQVRNSVGQWIDVPPVDNTFVVNVGDMMARWTNGLFASTVHRVINTSGRDRYSIPFFFDPNYDAPVAVLPTCTSEDNPPRFAPTTGLEHLQEMINASFAYRAAAPPA